MEFGEYLKQNRWSITAFAAKINYSRHHISDIIRGKSHPSKKLKKLIFKETEGQVSLDDKVSC